MNSPESYASNCDQWELWKKHFPAFEYLGERQVQKWKWAVNLNDLKWRIKSLWPWSSIRLFKRFLCNFYFTTLPLIWPVKFGININCTWSRWVTRRLKQGSTDRLGKPGKSKFWAHWYLRIPIFWAIRLTKLFLGHCGSFKVIVIEQFVWIETKTRSISIDFVLTVSNSENQIFLYLLLSQSESIISLIDPSLNLWPWSSIWAADLSLRSILHLSGEQKIILLASCRVKVNQGWITNCNLQSFNLILDRTVCLSMVSWTIRVRGQTGMWLGLDHSSCSDSLEVRWALICIIVFDAICITVPYFLGTIPCKLFMIRTWMGSSTVK